MTPSPPATTSCARPSMTPYAGLVQLPCRTPSPTTAFSHSNSPVFLSSATMNEAVTLSFTIYRRSPWSVGDAADPKPPVVSNAPRSAVQTVSPLILSAPTTPALPK